MEPDAYKAWWNLHLRVARNGPLDAVEEARYLAGARILEDGEKTDGDLERLRKLCADMADLEAENQRLREERRLLDAEIANCSCSIDCVSTSQG